MPFPFSFAPDNEGQNYDLSDAELASSGGQCPMDLAAIKYLQRDGGDIQGLGAGIDTFTFRCFYTGENYDERLRNLRAQIKRQPKGLLTHRELGPIRAHCRGIDEFSVDYGRETETVNFTISFQQDETETTELSARVRSVQSQGEVVKQVLATLGAATTRIGSLATFVAAFPTTVNTAAQSLEAIMAGLTEFTNIFVSSCVSVATLGVIDYTLSDQRDRVLNGCGELVGSLRATGLPDAALYPALAPNQQLYAECVTLYDITKAQGPQIVEVRVDGLQPLVVFCAQKYGPAAIARIEDVRAGNRIGSFGLQPGQVLQIPAPTVTPGPQG